MLTQARLTFRLHRFTFIAVAAVLVVGSAAALIVAAQLHATGATRECLDVLWSPTLAASLGPDCQQRGSEFRSLDGAWAGPLLGALGGLPPLAGLLCGVGLVAREIEDHTAALAWSLATSRTRWLVGRVAPVAAVLVVLFAFTSVAATELERARRPGVDPLLSFYNDGSRGLEVVAIGFLVFAVAVLVGSLLGRVLPSLIAASVVGLLLVAGVFVAEQTWIPSQEIIVDVRIANTYDGAYYIDQEVRLPSGELRPTLDFSFDYDANGNVVGLPAGATVVGRLIPGTSHPFVDAVVAAEMAVIAAGLLVLTAVVVRRRRPT
jgi:hypothetical protein